MQDETALLRWAKDILPVRSRLDETDRIALDRAFLRRAETIRADPELLSAFSPSQGEISSEAPHPSTISPSPQGGHDAQASL